MRICLCFPYFDVDVREPAQMMSRFPLLAQLPAALADRGHEVVVLQLAPKRSDLQHGGVRYQFRTPGWMVLKLGAMLQRWRPHEGPAYYQIAWRQALAILRQRPDIVHIFGLTLDPQLALLVRAAKVVGAGVLVHYHGGYPPRGRFARWFAQRHLQMIDRVLMTTAEQRAPWIEAGMLAPEQFRTMIESSVLMQPHDRSLAREQTKMHGDPVFVSTGRLDLVKDPKTMLRAFAMSVEHLPDPKLYLYYLDAPMIDELRQQVAGDARIRERVEFRGAASSEEMGAIYSSADFFLQASRREWSGLALIEALACGCIPIVSDIPSFRRLTDNGRVGRLFAAGDARAMAEQIVSLASAERSRLSDEARRWFDESLSFPAMARELERVYSETRHKFI